MDSSTIIALSKIGELDLLKDLFAEIHITSFIRREILAEGYPETNRIRRAVDEWIKVIDVEEEELQKYVECGLAKGEASLIQIAREDDRLILDDPVARDVARVEGLEFTGLIGLLVEASHAGLVSKERGRKILEKLSSSDFRMTAELYNWAAKRLGVGE